MITQSFDPATPAKLQPAPAAEPFPCDACIVTFSSVLRDYALANYPCRPFATIPNACGPTPLYALEVSGARLAFYMSGIGAPFAAGLLEEAACRVTAKRFVVFGGSGCLDREIAHGRVMVPTFAWRDEGTSYHYAPPADTIPLKNAPAVEAFFRHAGIPYVTGGTWTTDAIFRETQGHFARRKAAGCIAVEMECAALQAVCDFRGYELYYFLTSGDLLDAPVWDPRLEEGSLSGTQHDTTHLEIAAALARFISHP